jgi:simple sugar transport system permease protein
MRDPQLLIDLAAVLASSAPLIFATMGETITERAGVINLSLDGTILLAGMVGFAAGLHSESVLVGLVAAVAVGMLVSLVLSMLSITLNQSQTAVGFVLTLLCTDLSSFLGNAYVRVPGEVVPHQPVPLLRDIPWLGNLLFNHDLLIYASFLLIPATWWFLFHTRTGLIVRSLGERPEAAFARGINVTAWRYFYVVLGGALIGLAGAAYTLDIKQGWGHRHTAGMGWIALAIVIFGGWKPWRVAFGCYLFGALLTLASRTQGMLSWLPTQVFQVAPFVLMIGVLAIVNGSTHPAVARRVANLPPPLRNPLQKMLTNFAVSAPAALGKPFEKP